MASCNINTLLSDGKDFERLSDRQLKIAVCCLLCTYAGLPKDPAPLLASGVAFQDLSHRELELAKAQLLCNIVGGVS